VGLTSPLAEADLLTLFESGINGLRHQPGIFATLSAHTLSDDPLLLQVSVRRLMIFLRKLAWQRGQQYVFETNNVRFRQLVQASFERLLAALMARGALVAFEVVTTGSINTPDDLDNGRFLIELKVAPSNPVEFITVVLLRSGEGLLEVLER
jgi:phage tail sheath protein FI